jgi:hypothetical protein
MAALVLDRVTDRQAGQGVRRLAVAFYKHR